MLSDEEKAIEELKNKIADYFMISNLTGKTLVNLIEKQSKEIEELKEENEKYKNPPFFNEDNYTSNDKIKAKIEEWQKEKEFYDKDEDREWGQYNNWDWVDTIINEMQSLLEKE